MHECNQAISGWKEYHMSENTISLYVYKGGQGEITEKKSRFIATVRPVESEDEAVSFINETKKKYWDARHNCSAFVIGKRQELTRCSDDGEPANRLSDFLSFKSPASGRSSGASLYHGDVAVLPPIEPISTASESSAVAIASSVRGTPVASIEQPPIRMSV